MFSVIKQRVRAMSLFHLLLHVLLYFVSIGALLVLFGGVLTIFATEIAALGYPLARRLTRE